MSTLASDARALLKYNPPMYQISVQREFCAAHAISIGGRLEPMHGHNWRVTVVIGGSRLDRNGLLCDFHVVERELEQVTDRLDNASLNETAPFDSLNPTAEHVALYIGRTLEAALPGVLPAGVVLESVSVTEAPGCTATYRPARP